MKAILIRVGADGTEGGGKWLAPVDPNTNRVVYVPIPERKSEFFPGCERRFDEVAGPLIDFLSTHSVRDEYWRHRIAAKRGLPMHLDPDYEHLTYGDVGTIRGKTLSKFTDGDLIVFYSGLKPIKPYAELVYAVVGVYVVQRILSATQIADDRRNENAHARRAEPHEDDIVVYARSEGSGRCERCVPIGERRGSSYYLRPDVEEAWGGLKKADGSPRKSSWLNMSGVPPLLGDPTGFLTWWREQNVSLIRSNFAA